ncbi:hypothetical protein ORV05_02055 [Amycolatopsis cynarae]|uniref:WXG100 family type VII secretion target n=1 Tax=Amycolatopsis cynarae TaxID=2995223 RepID=A0ABY7B791_9PSEU|nr:hypothetical protein [Amycolatopsis sp. HUAS 11-8]WAL66623.1 hypothetical protein ORV05_02055 [Amycolatopsis sp. HUAS 11-8]
MPSQMINEQAKKKYHDFENAIATARMALDELTQYSKKMPDTNGGRFEGWQMPGKHEIVTALRKASADLDALRTAAVQYKAELISRTWRV